MLELLVFSALVASLVIAVWIEVNPAAIIPTLALLGIASYRIMPAVIRITAAVNNLRYCGPLLHTVAEDLRHAGEDRPPEIDASIGLLQEGIELRGIGFAYSNRRTGGPNADLYTAFIHERLALLRQAGVLLHVVDARDYQLLSPHLSSIEPTTVVQLAAVAHANRANKDPYSTFDHSMRTLENALDTVRERKPHFIFFSSSMVYGNFEGAAVTEDRVCEPIGIYGALKLAGEKLVIAYNQVFGMP